MITTLIETFTTSRSNGRSATIYSRALTFFTILKLITIWSVAEVLASNALTPTNVLSKFILLPAVAVGHSGNLAFGVMTGVLILTLFNRPNYISNAILFWIAFNLFIVKYPVTNGSDYLLVTMTLLNIPLSRWNFGNAKLQILNVGVFNLFFLLSKLEIIFIYLISGWDKLLNSVWRSGDAFIYISHLDTVFNPAFAPIESRSVAAPLAWIAVLFEFAFVVLVWKKRTRPVVLCVGVLFHLAIWITLSLPDFSLLMILCYILFINDEDWQLLHRRVRPSLP